MEQLLHYVWRHRLFPLSPLHTTEGKSVEVIDTGVYNTDAGPDFFNAKVKIDGVLWVGNVEIHTRTSDWFRHGHETDALYDTVVLHVVSEADAVLYRSGGETIPQLVLPIPDRLSAEFDALSRGDGSCPCRSIIEQLPALKLRAWVDALRVERLEQKAKQITDRWLACESDWERAFFITLARNFGFGVNSDVFELWARYVPLSIVQKHRDNLLQIEALFFGVAGLLPIQPFDDYSASLIREYRYLCHKFSLSPPPILHWKFLRLRPYNFPQIRLAQLACLYHHAQGLFSQIIETDDRTAIHRLLAGGTSDYWNTHYEFGTLSPSQPKSITEGSIDLIILNTVIPFLYVYGKYRQNETLRSRATEWLEALPPERNHIIREWENYGIRPHHAGDTQALLQWRKQYCDQRKCLHCRVGYEYLKGTCYPLFRSTLR